MPDTLEVLGDAGLDHFYPEQVERSADSEPIVHDLDAVDEDNLLMRHVGSESFSGNVASRKLVDKNKGRGFALRTVTPERGESPVTQHVPRCFPTSVAIRTSNASVSRTSRSPTVGSRVEILGELEVLPMEYLSMDDCVPLSFAEEHTGTPSSIPHSTSPQRKPSQAQLVPSILVHRSSSAKWGDERSLSLNSGARQGGKWRPALGMEDDSDEDFFGFM